MQSLRQALTEEQRKHAETRVLLSEAEERSNTLAAQCQEAEAQLAQAQQSQLSQAEARAASFKADVSRLQGECRGLKRKLSAAQTERDALADAHKQAQQGQAEAARLGRELERVREALASSQQEQQRLAAALETSQRDAAAAQRASSAGVDADDAALTTAVELATAELLQEQEAREEEWLAKEQQWNAREAEWQQRDEDWKQRDEEWQALQKEWEDRLARLQVRPWRKRGGRQRAAAAALWPAAVSCFSPHLPGPAARPQGSTTVSRRAPGAEQRPQTATPPPVGHAESPSPSPAARPFNLEEVMQLARAVRDEAAGQLSPAHSGTQDSLDGSSDNDGLAHVGMALAR